LCRVRVITSGVEMRTDVSASATGSCHGAGMGQDRKDCGRWV